MNEIFDSTLCQKEPEGMIPIRTDYKPEFFEIEWPWICPKTFLTFDLSKFSAGKEVYWELMNHDLSRSGLVIHGKSGSGKTRIGLETLKKAHSEGFIVSFMDAEEFASKAVAAYRGGEMRPFYSTMLTPQILMLDDLGKSKITQRVAEALFQVIDKRSRAMKTTIVTTNETDTSFSDRCEDKELALACIRRLKEFCKVKML